MSLAAGLRLGPYEIVAPSARAAWARCIQRWTRARRYAEEGLALAATRYVQPSLMGHFCASLGRIDEAFDWFDRACDEHDLLPVLNHFSHGHDAGIDGDPRWPALMRRIGVVPNPRRPHSAP